MTGYVGIYGSMKFPEYRYQEYPKWIKIKDASGEKSVVVESRNEEMKLLDQVVPKDQADGVVSERDALAKALADAQKELAALRAEQAAAQAATPAASAAAKILGPTKVETGSVSSLDKPSK